MNAADQTAPWRSGQGQLRSLWDILVEPFEPILFLRLMELAGISTARRIWQSPTTADLEIISNDEATGLDTMLGTLREFCVGLELPVSAATVRRMQSELAKPKIMRSNFNQLYDELGGRLRDEMKEKSLWSLNLKEAELFKEPRKGWQEVIARFPAAGTDIEEAAKCFALSRYAAAVFHSLQVVEIGLIGLGEVLVTNDPQAGWNATTNRLKKIISARYSDRTPFQQQHSPVLEQLNATTEILKNAWRNKVSHAQGKLVLLTSDFTSEIAEEILFASRGFMRRLASEMPSSPDPDA